MSEQVAQAQPPRCALVIRSYNEEKHIGRLLEGVMHQTLGVGSDVQIILVDSGSSDATVSIASRYPVQIVHIEPQAFTFGHSLNLGIMQAARSTELLVFASAHVYPVYPDWLETLLAPFVDPQIALVYGKQRGGETTHFSEHQIFARWFPEYSSQRQPTPFCNNANAAIRRKLWEQHAYDETLPGLEDLEWAHWAMAQGLHIAYTAEAEVIHVHDETPRGVYNRYRREAMAFHRIFPHERFRLIDFFRLAVTNIASDLFNLFQQSHVVRERLYQLGRQTGGRSGTISSIFWFRLMQFWGTYQGYRHTGPLTWQLRQTFYYPPARRNLFSKHAESEAEPASAQGRSVEPIRYT